MKISIIIPSYNGALRISNLLKSLQAQLTPADEIIVVIDGSTDSSLEVINQQKKNFNCFEIINQVNGGRANARNSGAKHASGDLLLFIDDDMIASNVWTQEHINHHLAFPESIMTGREENYNEQDPSDFNQFAQWLHRKWTNYKFEDEENKASRKLANPYITASNFSIPRDLFNSLGGFDERLKDAEDFDLSVRATGRKIDIYYNYLALAYNNEQRLTTLEGLIKRHREYNLANIHLKEINNQVSRYKTTYQPTLLKKLIFKLTCNKSLIKAIDKGYLKLLPPKIRFRIYDVVLTSNGTLFPDLVELN